MSTGTPITHHIPRTTSSAPSGPVRLTRRGRVVVLLTLLSLLLVAFSLGRSAHSEAAGRTPGQTSAPLTAYTQTTVHQGETLWSVARRVAPGHDPRGLVQQIRELNHLDSASVQAGQQLVLPKVA
jgi:LysM repeat protein